MNAETYVSPTIGDRRWCPDCRRQSAIEDVFEDSMWDTRGEVAFTVTALTCGHDLHSGGKVVMGYRSGGMFGAAAPVALDPWT